MFTKSIIAAVAAISLAPAGASAASITAIFGSGNADTHWTVDNESGIQLGLRAKLRFDENNQPANVFNYDGVDTYTFRAGSPTGGASWVGSTTPIWNFEWSINTDVSGSTGWKLDDLIYQLSLDANPGPFDAPAVAFDPIDVSYADHAIGGASTANGGGTVAGDASQYATLIANNTVAQNSWNYEFFNGPGSALENFDPNAVGAYTLRLTAFDPGTNLEVASANIDVSVSAVPVPAALPLMLGGLGALGLFARRRRGA